MRIGEDDSRKTQCRFSGYRFVEVLVIGDRFVFMNSNMCEENFNASVMRWMYESLHSEFLLLWVLIDMKKMLNSGNRSDGYSFERGTLYGLVSRDQAQILRLALRLDMALSSATVTRSASLSTTFAVDAVDAVHAVDAPPRPRRRRRRAPLPQLFTAHLFSSLPVPRPADFSPQANSPSFVDQT